MTSNLAKIIIEEFLVIVDITSKRCCIPWNKCSVKFVSRQYFDSLIIEVFKNDICDCNPYTLSTYIPLPLISIDFTNIKRKTLDAING